MAKTSPHQPSSHVLALELWGLGDLCLAMPFLARASQARELTLVAQAQAAPLLRRFAPAVDLICLQAPWTAFRRKYHLWNWPWTDLWRVQRELRKRRFETVVTARPDPREHLWMRLLGCPRRLGFKSLASKFCLTEVLPPPSAPHRADYWASLAAALALPPLPAQARVPRPRTGKLLLHSGAAQAARRWPAERWGEIADRLRRENWEVLLVDRSLGSLEVLMEYLDTAEAFIGNDSGPGHLAALLGLPTFTVFGPVEPERFAPRHTLASWISGAPCPHKPCWDRCHYEQPHCLLKNSTEAVWLHMQTWLQALRASPGL